MSAVQDAPRRTGRPRDARVDEQIVEATLAEVGERGFGGATVEGIAQRAGVGKATIYRRWPNREALLHFVAGQVADPSAALDTGDLRQDLLSVFGPLTREFYAGAAARLLPDMVAEAARDGAIRDFLSNAVEERRAGAVAAFERARKRGELRRGVGADMAVDLVFGALLFRFLLRGKDLDVADARSAISLAVDGVLR